MTREAFVHGEDSPEGGAAAGEGGTGRDYFTPLWRTKGAHSMGGGLLQPAAAAALGATGGIPGSNLVESEGFMPLRKVVRPQHRMCFFYLCPSFCLIAVFLISLGLFCA